MKPKLKLSDAELAQIARKVRCLVLESIHKVGTGHAGTSLSMIELLVYLYFREMNYRADEPHWRLRDRFILSKGHGAPGLYSTMAVAGFLSEEELSTLRRFGSRLQGHPSHAHLPGIDASTGSLGQGLSIGCGMAHAALLKNSPSRVFCILGDGEIQEGQNWEAMMVASSFGLTNLTAIVDRNGLQNDGPTENIIPIDDLARRAESFGWQAYTIDGHDYGQIENALNETALKPKFIVAETIKGKGVSYMENQVKWHHHPISDDELSLAMSELV